MTRPSPKRRTDGRRVKVKAWGVIYRDKPTILPPSSNRRDAEAQARAWYEGSEAVPVTITYTLPAKRRGR